MIKIMGLVLLDYSVGRYRVGQKTGPI